jgi:hypothetical protein
MELDSALFSTKVNRSSIRSVSGGTTEIDIARIQNLPKILGNTDPVRFIRTLPGVQTSSEYDSGIHIQGCDNSHNDISIGGVPVYGVTHLFGLFSIFNPSHHSKMIFSQSSETNRLGGTLKMDLPDTLKRNITGDITLGLLSAQGSIGIRSGNWSHLKISIRQSYMNLLYKKWLKIEESPTKYGFGDYNISWLLTPNKRDQIWMEGYFGQDKADISVNEFNVGLFMQWRNYMGAAHWRHQGNNYSLHQTMYFSGYDSCCSLKLDISSIKMNPYIKTLGYKGYLKGEKIVAGIDLTHFDVMPQNPETDGLYGTEVSAQKQQKASEASIYGEYIDILADRWTISARLRGNAYISPEQKIFWSISPDFSASFNAYTYGKITASYRWNRQHLFRCGISNIGLPIEFWFMAGKYSAPQYAQSTDITYDVSLFNQSLALSTSIYFKKLRNQIEYNGNLFDFFSSVYKLEDYLLKGEGWNYGLNLMAHKQSGTLTGWVSYSVGRALRRFDNRNFEGLYPANHERIHEINAVCSYDMGNWNLSGTFIYASGVPFTAPAYYYISSEHIITKPGEHNACRMRPYIRLDLSATYEICRKGNLTQEINLSLYNATGRRNDIMYSLKTKNGTYTYGPISFFLRWLPSISYCVKF